VFFLLLFGVASPARAHHPLLTREIVLQRAEFKRTPAALVFDRKGELYAGYRDKGFKKKSSAVWVRVFDPESGKELRSVQLKTAATPLPNGAEQFLLSPDDSWLVYSQFHGGIFLAAIRTATLKPLSEITSLPDGLANEFAQVASVDSSNTSVLLQTPKENHLNGVDARLVRLDARDLSHVLSNATLTNPIPESGFLIGPAGTEWIPAANSLYRYDPSTRKATLQLSLHNEDDIGHVVFLQNSSLLISSDKNDFGYLYRFKRGSPTPEASQRVEGCGMGEVLLSPNQLYGAALCEHQRTGEWHFGAITTRKAVIFDVETLKVLAEVPIKKDLYPELAIWHGGRKIVLATQADSNKIAIYEFPSPTDGSAPLDPRNRNVHLSVPVPVSSRTAH
jgi:hypothetical protein